MLLKGRVSVSLNFGNSAVGGGLKHFPSSLLHAWHLHITRFTSWRPCGTQNLPLNSFKVDRSLLWCTLAWQS